MQKRKSIILLAIGIVFLLTVSTQGGAIHQQPIQKETNPADITIWGKVLKKSLSTGHESHTDVHQNPAIFITLDYTVFGYGNHFIYWDLEYNVTHYDNTTENQRIGGDDELYMTFNPFTFMDLLSRGLPPWKLRAHETHEAVFYNLKTATWTARLYIDSVESPIFEQSGNI